MSSKEIKRQREMGKVGEREEGFIFYFFRIGRWKSLNIQF